MPITKITGDECSRNGSTRSEVNGRVEPHIDTLVGDAGVANNNFTALEFLLTKFASVLLGDHWRYVRLNSTSANTHDHDGKDEQTECYICVLKGSRSRRSDEDDMTEPVRGIGA